MAFTSETARAAQAKGAATKRNRGIKDSDKLQRYKVPFLPSGLPNTDKLLQNVLNGDLGEELRINTLKTLINRSINAACDVQITTYRELTKHMARDDLEGVVLEGENED